MSSRSGSEVQVSRSGGSLVTSPVVLYAVVLGDTSAGPMSGVSLLRFTVDLKRRLTQCAPFGAVLLPHDPL